MVTNHWQIRRVSKLEHVELGRCGFSNGLLTHFAEEVCVSQICSDQSQILNSWVIMKY